MQTAKQMIWIGSTLEDLRSFPRAVQTVIGHALHVAQGGGKADTAKPLKGIVTGGSVLEVIEDHDGNTYRAVYTVKFAGVVYVLHAFQKKSKRGIATPKPTIDLIKDRLKRAEEDYTHRAIQEATDL